MQSVRGLIFKTHLAEVDGMVDGVVPLDGDGDSHEDAARHGRLKHEYTTQ